MRTRPSGVKQSLCFEKCHGLCSGVSNKVERIRYDEAAQKVYINKDQCFAGISEEVWEYRIGAYQVMEKYLKDRKGRKLSLGEINHYMKVARAIRLTIELQGKVDEVYGKIDQPATSSNTIIVKLLRKWPKLLQFV